MQASTPARDRFDDEHLLWLKSLLLVMVTIFALIAAWHYGLLQQVLLDEPSGLACVIALVFVIAAVQGSACVWKLSLASNEVRLIEKQLVGKASLPINLPEGPVRRYVEAISRRPSPTPGDPADTLMDAFASEITAGHAFGWFVSDVVLSLGLLGTVIGFIAMLAPIGALNGADELALKSALTEMSGGMAIALYTTLVGLIGALWLKLQGYLLDHGADEVIRRMKWIIEFLDRRDPARPSLFKHRSSLSELIDG